MLATIYYRFSFISFEENHKYIVFTYQKKSMQFWQSATDEHIPATTGHS